jgi:hypothetical protein
MLNPDVRRVLDGTSSPSSSPTSRPSVSVEPPGLIHQPSARPGRYGGGGWGRLPPLTMAVALAHLFISG